MTNKQILTRFGNKWTKAQDCWMIAECKKKQERLIKWAVKKLGGLSKK